VVSTVLTFKVDFGCIGRSEVAKKGTNIGIAHAKLPLCQP
jgi:hypothetical protein